MEGERIIKLDRRLYDEIISHAIESYPNECCGVIVGAGHEGDKSARRLYRVANTYRERLRDRFSIDGKDLLRIERDIKDKNLEIIGFYHSHPDHPCFPSKFDREMAWPMYSYIIIGVSGADRVEARSWVLLDEEGEFLEEEIIIEE